jgi:hypothetical protein
MRFHLVLGRIPGGGSGNKLLTSILRPLTPRCQPTKTPGIAATPTSADPRSSPGRDLIACGARSSDSSGLPSLGSGAAGPNRTAQNHQPQNSKAREGQTSAGSNPAATASGLRSFVAHRRQAWRRAVHIALSRENPDEQCARMAKFDSPTIGSANCPSSSNRSGRTRKSGAGVGRSPASRGNFGRPADIDPVANIVVG